MTRPSPPTRDRDRSRLSRWWDAVPQEWRALLVLGIGIAVFLLAGLLARL